MKKILFLFAIQLTVFSYSTAFSQNATIQDALEFISSSLDQSNKVTNSAGLNSFYEVFPPDNSYDMYYDYKGQTTYSVISTDYCTIKLLETFSDTTRIAYTEDHESADDAPINSNFVYLKQDTITIPFSKISSVEADKTTITFSTYNNMDLIKHNGQIMQTPPPKRKNDLVRFFKENEDELYGKLKKFSKKNNINYKVYPNQTEYFEHSSNKYTISNIEKEKCKRLAKAFEFLQKNCGVPKEKF